MDLRRRKRASPIIPIVPLVDILVVLLMFFIATTTFKKKREQAHHLQISLPQSNAMGGAVTEKEPRHKISIDKDQNIYLDYIPTPEAGLADALKELKAKTPGLKLELQADQDASIGLLVKIWDALKVAGFSINDVPARIQRAGEGK